MVINVNFERLFFLREEKDLTQEDMGKILNVSRVAISQWKTGKEVIPLEKLNIYSNYFNVNRFSLICFNMCFKFIKRY